jgi:hypothetical protein
MKNSVNNTLSAEMTSIHSKQELSIEEIRKIISLLGSGMTVEQIEALYHNSEFL